MCLERRADSQTHRLGAVSAMDPQVQSKRSAGVSKPRAQAVGRGLATHLGGRTHWHVDQDVG